MFFAYAGSRFRISIQGFVVLRHTQYLALASNCWNPRKSVSWMMSMARHGWRRRVKKIKVQITGNIGSARNRSGKDRGVSQHRPCSRWDPTSPDDVVPHRMEGYLSLSLWSSAGVLSVTGATCDQFFVAAVVASSSLIRVVRRPRGFGPGHDGGSAATTQRFWLVAACDASHLNLGQSRHVAHANSGRATRGRDPVGLARRRLPTKVEHAFPLFWMGSGVFNG